MVEGLECRLNGICRKTKKNFKGYIYRNLSERTGRSNFTLPELLNELNSLPLKQEPGEDVNLNG